MLDTLGYDPSLTSSGFAYREGSEVHTGRITTGKLRDLARLSFIRVSFTKLLRESTPQLITYEDYAMGGRGQKGRFFSMGEGGGVAKLVAYEAGVDILLVSPSSLKMFATGHGSNQGKKGKEAKQIMIDAISRNWGYSIPQNDEADAFALMKMGEAYASRRVARQYTAKQRSAFDKCHVIRGVR